MKKFVSSKNLEQKFLTDECVGSNTVGLLRSWGYDVLSAKEAHLFGKSDNEYITLAIRERRILVTLDIELGNITLYPPHLHNGVIVLRFRHDIEGAIHNNLKRLLEIILPEDLSHAVTIVDDNGYRIRK